MSAEATVWPSRRECWEAARWVLLALTLVVGLALAGSFVPYEQVVAEGHPWLPRRVCAGCPLCGMTRSFCAMSGGRWREALAWNRGGPVMYVSGWLWLAASAVVIRRQSAGRRSG
ncbi:MAG TPA: DUF2752 domain-containing protein [Pyrinomonadaceae bacterium]|nr:DUF2752 domain-containing protein [Pyrinomonadaceae bacterium]